MEETAKPKSYRECAMRDGTLLGSLWIVTFTMFTIMIKNMFANTGITAVTATATVILMTMSPIMAYKMAKRHTLEERDGRISFSEAWLYIMTMYMCAIVLSAIAEYIYFAFADTYLFHDFLSEFRAVAMQAQISEEESQEIQKAIELLGSMSAVDIVLSTINSHLFRVTVITTILAFMLKRNPDKNLQ